jgi:hypothetical protein
MVGQLSAELARLKAALGLNIEQQQQDIARPMNVSSKGDSMGQAQKDAQTENMTAYGERLAQRAKPDMDAQ